MSAPHQNHVEEALEELRRQRERLAKARRDMTDRATSVSSKDRMVSVTVDGRGAITQISFGSTKFRRMAPAELGAVLVDTINAARQAALNEVAEKFQPMFPDSLKVKNLLSGKLDIDQMFADAMRLAKEPMPGEEPTMPYSGEGRKNGNG